MTKPFLTLTALSAALVLSACMFDRAAADARLARACVAAVKAMETIPDGSEIKGPEGVKFSQGASGKEFRQVNLFLIFDDGWYQDKRAYQCVFQESIGMTGSHKAVIHHLQLPGKEFGKRDGEIIGSMQDHLKLTNAVKEAL